MKVQEEIVSLKARVTELEVVRDLLHEISERTKRLETGFEKLETKMDTKFEQVDHKSEQIGNRVQQIDGRLQNLEGMMGRILAKLDA